MTKVGRGRLRDALAPALGLLLFAAALAILYHQLRAYPRHEILADVARLPPARIVLALLLTLINYLVLTLYELLGLRFIGSRLSYRRIALASFVSYVLSHNVGASFLSGSAARFHLYSGWGLSASEIGSVVALNVLTFWLGFLALLGVALLVEPPLPIPASASGLAGVACLAVIVSYVLLAAVRRDPLHWRRWSVPVPSLGLALKQIAVSTVDWALAAGVLFVILPPAAEPSFARFVGTFLVAQVAGVASHVPAGLGVFEAVMLHLLSPPLPTGALLGSLLVYRAVYYVLPLVMAAGLLGVHEAIQRRAGMVRLGRVAGRWLPALIPDAFAATTFLGGVVLLASGATPAAGGRMGWLRDILPLPLLEISRFLASVVGGALLLLAHGLQRRLNAAYVLAGAMLAAGAAFSLLQGPHYAEAAILAVILAALLPCRRRFHRRTALLDEAFSAEWIVAILLVALGVSWLLFFSYRHVEYSSDLWWQFELSADAPRSLRATAGAVVLLVLYGVTRLLRAARPEPAPPTPDDLGRVRALVAQSRTVDAHLALLGDKRFLFNPSKSALIMYAIEGRSWVALRDPIGPENEIRELAWRFRELSDRHGGWTVFYEVARDHLPLYLDLGLGVVKLGEEARVPLASFSLECARKSLRRAHNHVAREGFGFEIVPASRVESLLPRLKVISDAWLAQKHTREKGFSLGFFAPEYLRLLPATLVSRGGQVCAFANLLLGAEKEELSIDLMRYDPEAPPGVMDFLLTELLLWGKAEGYRWFNLGMAPFSGFEDRALGPLWNRLGAFLFRHGEHFYNLQGLRQYKEKFDPAWEPRYLASPGGLALPRVLANVAALVSRGLKGVVSR